MIKAVIFSHVPVEEQDEYLRFVREELKPFHEAHGCRAYNVFREVARENNKDFVASEQLVTEVLFDDAAVMEKFRELFDTEPLKSMMKRFFSFKQSSNKHYISVI